MSNNVLIADDETYAAKIIADFLAHKGYGVTIANDGVEAYKVFCTQEFDLLLTDLRMPREGGVEFVYHVRANDRNIPIIVMTGYKSDTLQTAAMNAGADAVIGKPVSLRELSRLVDDLTKGTVG